MAPASDRLRTWIWPPPARAAERVVEVLTVGALLSALVGVVGLVLEVHRLRLGVVGVGALACAAAAPGLGLLAAALADRREQARRVGRCVLPALALAAVWLASEALGVSSTRAARKAVVVSALVALLATWAWVTLGRADVRERFSADAPRGVAGPVLEVTLPLYGVFVMATLAAAFAIRAGGVASVGGAREGALLLGALASGGVTTVGVVAAWRLWRGPDADIDLVTPEAWTRILALHQEGVDDIAAALEREGFAPPGRCWNAEVVVRVLLAAGVLTEPPDDDEHAA